MPDIWRETPTHRFVFAVVRRIATLLLPLGYSLGEFLGTAKAAFVDVAAEQIRTRGDRISTSRIAVITGLTRPEVARIRSQHKTRPAATRAQRTTTVMDGWFNDPEFADQVGRPKTLRLRGAHSFAKLVKKYGRDVPPRAVLRELVAEGLAEQNASQCVVPVRMRPAPSDPLGLDFQELALRFDVLVADACDHRSPTAISPRRVSVSFRTPIPKAVIRNVNVRTERFLNALSEYLRGVVDQAPPSSIDQTEREPFHVVIAVSNTTLTPAQLQRHLSPSQTNATK